MVDQYDGLRVVNHGPVIELVIDRAGVRNALEPADRNQLRAALEGAAADPEVRAVVLTGAGPVFCAGGNIAGMRVEPVDLADRFTSLTALVTTMARGRLPIVAVVEGGAYGLGLGLASLCDLVVTGRSALFAASFVKLGLTADTGITWSLTRRIGWARTRRLLLTTVTLDADTALAWGIADELVPDGTASDRALVLVEQLAGRSPTAVAATRRLMADLPDDVDSALAAEAAAQSELMLGAEFAAAREAFLARRAASSGGVR